MTQALTLREEQHPVVASMPEGAVARGVTPEAWNVLTTILFKDANPETILTLIDYCKARKLDPLKRPFHIVKVYNSDTRRMEDSIWPGIGELRTTAMRTGQYAGKAKVEFGENVTEQFEGCTVTYPEWAQATVYRLVDGHRVEFAGSPVYWKETYASVKSGAPNSMWRKRPRGQLAKCAEAEALRSAFPEELGHEVTAEEMEGQTVERVIDAPAVPAAAYQAVAEPEWVTLYDKYGEELLVAPGESEAKWDELLKDCSTVDEVNELARANNLRETPFLGLKDPWRERRDELAPAEAPQADATPEHEPVTKPAAQDIIALAELVGGTKTKAGIVKVFTGHAALLAQLDAPAVALITDAATPVLGADAAASTLQEHMDAARQEAA